jgi:hypothetical protein
MLDFGFHFKETMRGNWRPVDGGAERPIEFTVTARAASLFEHVRDKMATLEGTLNIEGLAHGAAVTGELTIDPLFGKVIRYVIGFNGDDGAAYRLEGQKDVRFTDLLHTMTTLPARIRRVDGPEVGSALLFFDKRDLPRFLASFRLG